MSDPIISDIILGIDLGSNSLGWALISRENGRPAGILRAGARIFESAMEGNMAAGKEESRNRARREARLQRRQLWRRARRLKKTLHLLQRFGLLPEGQSSTPEARQDLINRLDDSIRSSPWFKAKRESGLYPEPEQVLPYILRAAALDEPLEPHFLGRALCHLAQRRGFRSNRKQVRATTKKDEEGVVKEGIAQLSREMQQSGARTLGEFLARLSPTEKSADRIRRRWTAREMYEDEFSKIWDAQAKHQPTLLTAERKKVLFQAIFHQRPLKFDPNVIGSCSLERAEKRAPAYLLAAQRFRLLDGVNNLRINGAELTAADRTKLIHEIERNGNLSVKRIPKLLHLAKDDQVNLAEDGDDKEILGDRTAEQFCKVFGNRWLEMPPAERDAVVEYVHAFEKPDKLKSAAQKKWGLSEEAAGKLAEIRLEPDYMNFSRKAIGKLLPLLEAGLSTATARRQLYPEVFKPSAPLDLLPPLCKPESRMPEIRNPAVTRSLTELRKVVNAIIREHGKPAEIRIELARELKKPKKARARQSKKMRENETARKAAVAEITEITGDPYPHRDDIRRVQLFRDSRGECVYCGSPISKSNFLGKESQVDVDHILPFSRSFDDSYMNLVICHAHCNREKANRTPREAFSGEQYEAILDRLSRFTGDRSTTAEKLRRFKMNPEELAAHLEDFNARQLNDTAYAARLAKQYLGLLYGGEIDADHNRRIHASAGQTTAFLRNEWKLNAILGDGPTSDGGAKPKSRDDHRHHAVDAVAIALTDAGTVKMLSDAAQRAPLEHRRRFAPIPGPWPNFVDSVREQIEKVVVSHRVSKKVSGALHEETTYGRLSDVAPGRRIRKPLSALSKPEIEEIADPSVKKLVLARLRELGGEEPKEIFSEEGNLPAFQTRAGRRIPIRSVRLEKPIPTFALGVGSPARHVASESNHHIELFAELDAEGNEVEWDGEVVPLARTYERMRQGTSVVQRDHGLHREFKFSLAAGEVIECDRQPGKRGMFVVRKMTQFTSGGIQIGFAPLNDARQARKMQTSRSWLWSSPDKLRERHVRKVVVGPLGEISEAHD
ncbi:MAG: type II CRISPR RNA-guided endonuclease Cas9 [Candidatus Acidiferrales bacterium]